MKEIKSKHGIWGFPWEGFLIIIIINLLLHYTERESCPFGLTRSYGIIVKLRVINLNWVI